jgi:hypothetical protein
MVRVWCTRILEMYALVAGPDLIRVHISGRYYWRQSPPCPLSPPFTSVIEGDLEDLGDLPPI